MIATETHRHKCKCGYVWEHGDNCGDNLFAHTCIKCGAEVWTKYFGREKPTSGKIFTCEGVDHA